METNDELTRKILLWEHLKCENLPAKGFEER